MKINTVSQLIKAEYDFRREVRESQHYQAFEKLEVAGQKVQMHATNGCGRMKNGLMVIWYIDGKRVARKVVEDLVAAGDYPI
jgi:hypothetical protein